MKKALSLYYAHANNALRSSSETFAWALSHLGYETTVIDLTAPGAIPQLDRLISSGEIDFCYGIQGIGSNLETNDNMSLWSAHRIPFICIHYDSPCYNPFNHFNASRYVANMYFFESFLDIKQRYLPSDQVSVVVPFQLPTERMPVVCSAEEFSARPIRLLYLKTGGSLDETDEYINSLPLVIRNGIRRGLALTVMNPNLQICDIVADIFSAAGLDWRKKEKQFWGVVQTMDDHIRRRRAIDFVNWLKFQEGAVIVGDGWDFIDKTGARAVFKPSVDINEANALCSQARFFCNTNPYGCDIFHERILLGFMSNCIAISDTNAWLDKNFGFVPALKQFDWASSLDDQLQPVLRSPQAPSDAQTGPPTAFDVFTRDASAQPLIDMAEKVREFASS